MMRGIAKGIVTLIILFAMAVGGYYAYRRQINEDYSLAYAPKDLLHEAVGLITSRRDSGEEELRPVRVEPPPRPEEGPAAADSDLYERGREAYDAGDYAKAIPLLADARKSPGDRSTVEIDTVLSRARLFASLLSSTERDGGLVGPPVALLTPLTGNAMLVTLTSEDDDAISFRTSKGMGAKIEKSELAALRIARNREARIALFEDEYRRRHEKLESSEDHLDLARYAWAHGLAQHVTYLLERALKAPGDAVEAALCMEYFAFLDEGEMARAEVAKSLMREFFPEGSRVREILAPSRLSPDEPVAGGPSTGDTRPGPTALDPAGGRGGAVPPSGIGATGTRHKRSLDPEVNALLEKADNLRGVGDDHYRLAFPGMPDAAGHRKKALDAYEGARSVYTELEEKWGVGFDRTIRELNERIYQLRKDTPVK